MIRRRTPQGTGNPPLLVVVIRGGTRKGRDASWLVGSSRAIRRCTSGEASKARNGRNPNVCELAGWKRKQASETCHPGPQERVPERDPTTPYAAGDGVRIRPEGRADVMDITLQGKAAVIESIEQDAENRIYLALVLDEDPGKDLGFLRQPGHRFFYGLNEVEPLRRNE